MATKQKGQYQKNLDQASAGANQSGGSPVAFAGQLAQRFAQKINGAPQQPTNVADPSLLSYEAQAQEGPHAQAMREAAEAAKLKYMKENGVDENGNPVAQPQK